jgi:hypothetical protein
MIVTLNPEEMAELFRQDETRRGGGWQRKLISFQQKLNKTTGELALMPDDIEFIKKYGSQPELGTWEKWIRAAFQRHIDLDKR